MTVFIQSCLCFMEFSVKIYFTPVFICKLLTPAQISVVVKPGIPGVGYVVSDGGITL